MTITDAGWDGMISNIGDSTGSREAAFDYAAIGIGVTAANAADTTLDSEITTNGGERAQATYAHTGSTKVWTIIHTWNFTGTFAVTEAGVLNAASTGTLQARQVFSAKNVISGDSLQVTWTFTGS